MADSRRVKTLLEIFLYSEGKNPQKSLCEATQVLFFPLRIRMFPLYKYVLKAPKLYFKFIGLPTNCLSCVSNL